MFKLWLENLSARKIYVYNRTNQIENNKKYGLDKKSGPYGSGVYFTYDLESQLKQPIMRGRHIIKSLLTLDNFLILDPVYSRKYNGTYNLSDQTKNEKDKELLTRFDSMMNHENTTKLAKILTEEGVTRRYNGLLYISPSEGHVGVVYALSLIRPVSYADSAKVLGRWFPIVY